MEIYGQAVTGRDLATLTRQPPAVIDEGSRQTCQVSRNFSRHMKLHVKSQIVMYRVYINGRPSLHINLRNVFIYCTKQFNHHLYITFIVMYNQLHLVPIYNIIFMSGAHGVAGWVWVGTAGCLWIGGCSMLWRLGGFGAVVREFYMMKFTS